MKVIDFKKYSPCIESPLVAAISFNGSFCSRGAGSPESPRLFRKHGQIRNCNVLYSLGRAVQLCNHGDMSGQSDDADRRTRDLFHG